MLVCPVLTNAEVFASLLDTGRKCVILSANMAKGLPMLRQIREAQGYSLRALANKAAMAYPALYRLESGEADPRLSTLKRLAAALNVTVADLIGEGKSRSGGTGRR